VADTVGTLRRLGADPTSGVDLDEPADEDALEKLDVPRPEIIVPGDQRNTVQNDFVRRDRRFHRINMGFPDEPFESFDTFEELLLAVMRNQQVLA